MLLLNLVLRKSIYITVITQNFDTGLKTKHTHTLQTSHLIVM